MRRDTHKGLSIFYRMLVFFLGAAISFTAVLSVVFYLFSKNSLDEHIAEDILQDFGVLSTRFQHDLKEHVITDLQLLASNPVLDEFMMSSEIERAVNARLVERLFLQSIRYAESYQSVSFVDYAGKERVRVAGTERRKRYRDMSRSPLFSRIQEGAAGSVHVAGPFVDKNGKASFLIGINKTDPDIGQFGGAVLIRYSLEEFFGYLDKMMISGQQVVWVFAPSGTVMKRPANERTFLDPRPYLSPGVRNVPALQERSEGIVMYQDFSIVSGRPFLRISVSVPSSLVLENIRSVLRFLFLVFLLSVPILSFVAYVLSRYIARPITDLARAAEYLAGGDLSTRVSVQTTGEVQMLVESFNRMAEDLALTTVSKEYVDNIINSMIDTLIVISPEGNILQANAAARTLLGYTEEELIGQGIELIIKEGVQKGSSALDDLITLGYVDNTEQTYIAKDGRQMPVLFSGAAMQGGDGAIQAIVCVAQDITQRKHAEEQLKAFAAKLEKSNKELEDFAYVASHDLQEPLRKVTAFGEQLKSKYGKKLGEKGGDYLERMHGAARRMQGLINNLLTYSRITTKAQPFIPVDLGSVAREVLSDLEVRINQTKGRVDVGDLPTIEADPLQMRQLFQNLIGNALKFHRENDPPVVTIRSALFSGGGPGGEQSGADGKLCRITITDNGIGFDAKDADRIFGVFQRLHGRSEYEGTGIGLAICRKLVERHGGTITAKSTPGRETVFTVELPVAHERGGEIDD